MIVEQSLRMSAPPASRSSSPRSASARRAPPRRSARTASTPAGVGAGRILVGGALLVLVALLASGIRRSDRCRAARSCSPPARSRPTSSRSSPPSLTRASRSARSSRSARRPRWRARSSGRSSARRPSRAWAMATALACAGVAMLALAGADADISLPGVGLALCAGASYAGYTLAAKRMLAPALARDRDGGCVRPRRGAPAARAGARPARAGSRARRRRAGRLPRRRPDRRRLPAVRPRAAAA